MSSDYLTLKKDELNKMIELANSEGRNNRIVTLQYFPPSLPTQIDGAIAIQYWSEELTGERKPL